MRTVLLSSTLPLAAGCLLPELGNLGSGGSNLGPDDGGAVSSCEAGLCDDFDRTSPLGPLWEAIDCDPGATLAVDHALHVGYPSHAGVGNVSYCALRGTALPSSPNVHVDIDVRLESPLGGTDVYEIAFVEVGLATVAASGLKSISYQLRVDPDGAISIGVVSYYPDPSRSPDKSSFPFKLVAASEPGAFVVGTTCRVGFDVRANDGAASATATCGTATVQTLAVATVSERLPDAQARLSLGYQDVTTATAVPARSITFGRVAIRLTS